MAVEATPPTAGFASRGSNYSAKQARLDKDEKELEELMKGRTDVPEDTEEENGTDEEEAAEAPEVKEDAEEDDSNLSREEKSFKKRYGDLRRHMADKEKEWKDKLEVATTEQSDSIRAPKSDEDIEAWARKYPDVAAIVETIADKKAAARFSAAEGRFKELDEAKYEATRTKAETSIREAHTDFDDLRDADTFHDWVDEQPKWVRDALYENLDDADSVIRVLDLYKVDNGLTPSAKKAKAKDAAKTVKRTSRTAIDTNDAGSMIKESDVAKMSDKQFEDRYDAIQDAMSSGKFVYDVSGKAR
tara:strand:+ start:9403 stop:10308 length:906 start_codon:yes stop_codon:yes gene_type:complete